MQDLCVYSTYPSLETCATYCRVHGSRPATWAIDHAAQDVAFVVTDGVVVGTVEVTVGTAVIFVMTVGVSVRCHCRYDWR